MFAHGTIHPASSPPALACKAALNGVHTMVAVALSFVEAGRPIDLAGLDATAGRVCAQALDLSPDEGAGLRTELERLAARLEALSTAIHLRL